MIITDHHTPNTSGELPRAIAVVNPHRKDSQYTRFPIIAGVGVAFKMGEALTRLFGTQSRTITAKRFWTLTAIGTITDVMPLHG